MPRSVPKILLPASSSQAIIRFWNFIFKYPKDSPAIFTLEYQPVVSHLEGGDAPTENYRSNVGLGRLTYEGRIEQKLRHNYDHSYGFHNQRLLLRYRIASSMVYIRHN